jgi:hypothetical protein
MSTTAADSIAGVVIPDTGLVTEITAFIRDTEDDLLFDHSRAGVSVRRFGRWAEQPAYADPAESIGSTADHFNFRENGGWSVVAWLTSSGVPGLGDRIGS